MTVLNSRVEPPPAPGASVTPERALVLVGFGLAGAPAAAGLPPLLAVAHQLADLLALPLHRLSPLDDPNSALAALRACEGALGWPALAAHGQNPAPGSVAGPVFLKGNQHSGQFLLRAEAGLGEGILISGHLNGDPDPALEGTWGPMPLDLFNA